MERLFPDPRPVEISALLETLSAERDRDRNRPHVFTNFAVTLDGRATIEGRSGRIGSETDTELLMALREIPDAVMIGAGTLRAECYGRVVPTPARRQRRLARGLGADPLVVVVTRSLELPWGVELFSCGEGEVLILTISEAEAPATATPVEVWRYERAVDLDAALKRLRAEREVRSLLCEGGPHLHGSLLEAGLVDDLFVTVGAKLAGGGGPRLIEGVPEHVHDLELVWLLREGEELFARYAIRS